MKLVLSGKSVGVADKAKNDAIEGLLNDAWATANASAELRRKAENLGIPTPENPEPPSE